MRSGTKDMTCWGALIEFFPTLVRLAARRPVGGDNVLALSNAEIAIASGLPIARVVEISHLFSWNSVTVGEMRRFFSACRFDPTQYADRKRQYDLLRKCKSPQTQPPRYLRQSPYWQTEFLPLIEHLKTYQPMTRFSDDFATSPSRHQNFAA